jgi:hypothetical protein
MIENDLGKDSLADGKGFGDWIKTVDAIRTSFGKGTK